MSASRWTAVLRTASEWGPPALVAVLSQLPLGLEEPWVAGRAALALAGVALALPLLWRTTRPVVVCAVIAVVLVLQGTIGGTLHFGAFVAALVAVYSAGRYAARLREAVGAALLILTGAGAGQGASMLEEPIGLVFPLFYFGAGVLLGRVVGVYAAQAEELRRANAELAERQHDAARLAVAAERVRLARDLHDTVAHTVMVMVVQADAGLSSLERAGGTAGGHDDVAAALEQIKDTGQRGLRDLRGLVRVLRDDEPAPAPGLGELDVLVTVLGRAGLRVAVVGAPAADLHARLGPAASADLFRVGQEALTNVLRHSEATTAEIRLGDKEGSVLLEVRDPGPARATGTARAAQAGGHGLVGMRERLGAHDGVVESGPDGAGFLVRARVPVAGVVPTAPVVARR